MKDYRAKVKEAARVRDGSPLYNGSLDHAAVLAEAIFANAESEVNILSGSLNARVYGTTAIVEKARQFLSDTTHKVRILIEEPEAVDPVDHIFVTEFAENDDVQFREMTSEMKLKIGYHFIVMDGDSYRFEEDKKEAAAIAAFGDQAGGKRLTEVFDVLWNASEDYDFNVPQG